MSLFLAVYHHFSIKPLERRLNQISGSSVGAVEAAEQQRKVEPLFTHSEGEKQPANIRFF